MYFKQYYNLVWESILIIKPIVIQQIILIHKIDHVFTHSNVAIINRISTILQNNHYRCLISSIKI